MILLLSNGHGEDAIATSVGLALRERLPTCPVQAFPLVGLGRTLAQAGFPLVGVQAEMPSGGFIRAGLGAVWADLRAGFIGLSRRQWRALVDLRTHVSLCLAVGDALVLSLALYALQRPVVFMSTAKSDYIRPHYGWEVRLMRRAERVFARDARTASSLTAAGVPALYVGNVMMDLVGLPGHEPVWPGGPPTVALMPGSRAEAYQNLAILLAAVQKVCERSPQPVRFLLALAGGLDDARVGTLLQERGWRRADHAPAGYPTEDATWTMPGGTLIVAKGKFAQVLAAAHVAMGMAGTANEQAVGVGVPVVAPVGPGPQFTARFAQAQRRLLGESVAVIDAGPEAVAQEVLKLLADPALRARRAAVGRERMGGPGASAQIADVVAQLHLTHPAGCSGKH